MVGSGPLRTGAAALLLAAGLALLSAGRFAVRPSVPAALAQLRHSEPLLMRDAMKLAGARYVEMPLDRLAPHVRSGPRRARAPASFVEMPQTEMPQEDLEAAGEVQRGLWDERVAAAEENFAAQGASWEEAAEAADSQADDQVSAWEERNAAAEERAAAQAASWDDKTAAIDARAEAQGVSWGQVAEATDAAAAEQVATWDERAAGIDERAAAQRASWDDAAVALDAKVAAQAATWEESRGQQVGDWTDSVAATDAYHAEVQAGWAARAAPRQANRAAWAEHATELGFDVPPPRAD